MAPAPTQSACCYFAAKDKDISQPGQKAFLTFDPDEKIETFTVQPKFEGNAVDFGMVIPTPSRPKLDEMGRDFFKKGEEKWAKEQLAQIDRQYDESKGAIVKFDKPVPFYGTKYVWYPNREAPAEEVKGLSRLKGHLQKGQWLTKIRKVLRKDEMTDDLVFVPVAQGETDEYVRIMPTSPP